MEHVVGQFPTPLLNLFEDDDNNTVNDGGHPTVSHVFRRATADICTDEDLQAFLQGSSAQEFLSFVVYLNDSVCGREMPTTDISTASMNPYLKSLVDILDKVGGWVDEIPPRTDVPIRFGNPAFRTWLERVRERAPEMLSKMMTREASSQSQSQQHASLAQVVVEIQSYFVESFGNATRIDYGTGHETTFVAMLFCMAKVGLVRQKDAADVVERVFVQYLDTVRKVQRVYCLEPAGTRGVWGLDDYQMLPFMWGSSQLVDHPVIRPSSIYDSRIVEMYHRKYLYIGCIKFIRDIKHGPFHETSPMLHDISGLPSWSKINGGMMKMYVGEILRKRQVMQHFLIGSIITLNTKSTNE